MSADLLARLRAKHDPDNPRRFGLINPNGPEAATYIEQITAENERLREALIQAGSAVGCVLSDEVSTDFLMLIPAEVEAKIATLNPIEKD